MRCKVFTFPLRLHAFVAMHLLHACDGVCESKEAYMCNKGLIKAFGGKLFNFMLFLDFSPSLPPPQPHPAFTCICCNVLHYACDGVCGSREARMCNEGLIKAFGGKLSNFKQSETN